MAPAPTPGGSGPRTLSTLQGILSCDRWLYGEGPFGGSILEVVISLKLWFNSMIVPIIELRSVRGRDKRVPPEPPSQKVWNEGSIVYSI